MASSSEASSSSASLAAALRASIGLRPVSFWRTHSRSMLSSNWEVFQLELMLAASSASSCSPLVICPSTASVSAGPVASAASASPSSPCTSAAAAIHPPHTAAPVSGLECTHAALASGAATTMAHKKVAAAYRGQC
eukprot:scaffold958_cov325-Prasinococcus_capsulatus_cf.AAC.3